MTELEQLRQAIAAIEEQRAILGDTVVETALAPIRAKLDALQSQVVSSESKRKQVTVLFADVSGFTAMSETLDAEEVTEIMNALWERLDAAITVNGGKIDKHIGDAVMALWGTEAVREDDSEYAIRAALAMQAALASFRDTSGVQLAMRIGLNTGLVLLGEVGSTHEVTAMGDTVNLASRLEHAAPVGGILISHDTYRHVRGVFDVQSQSPLAVKGKSVPVQTYLVQRAKPRAFRMGTRGVEGLETRLIGRDMELLALQNEYTLASERTETRFVTIVGEAGVGKSRLLYEFECWLELRPELIYVFKGRAIPVWQHTPNGLLRDLFASRFDIRESDSATVAREKFRNGMAGILPPERADLVGHWIGFDFSGSQAVQNLIGSPDFGKLGKAYLTNYVRNLVLKQPIVIFLEDLHWADDSSLELLGHLVTVIPNARLLFVGLTRPSLFERHPLWRQDRPAFVQLELRALTKTASRILVEEILQKVETLPQTLRDLIVERAEGNPFYVEELIKMFLEEGVIDRGQETWQVDLARLNKVRVPLTLTGLLQARLDSLPRNELEPLQCASVVGRTFWNMAVANLVEAERTKVDVALEALRTRELIFDRKHSTFAETEEYIFKHALLRDVTYETVLLKLRRNYHAQVARWLQVHAGERLGEYAGLIAEHLERAEQNEQAASYLRLAAEKANMVASFREALEFSRRALALLPENSPERAGLMVQVGEALVWLGDNAEARRQLEAGLAFAQQLGDSRNCAAMLDCLGIIATTEGEWPLARTQLEKSLALARTIDDRARLAHALWSLGWLDIRQGAYPEARERLLESRALYLALGDRPGLARVLAALGSAAYLMGEYEDAKVLYLESRELYRERGSRQGEAGLLNNLGEIARVQGDYQAARQYYQEALNISKEIDSKITMVSIINNLGHVASASGDYAAAIPYYKEALQIGMNSQTIPRVLESLAGWSGMLASTGQPRRALTLLGLAIGHPALDDDTRCIIEQVLTSLRSQLPSEEIESELERCKTLHLETVVAELLKEQVP